MVFNKIGAYTHSVLAKEHKILFFVAALISAFDSTLLERDVKIEEWSSDELQRTQDVMLAPDAAMYNPVFDATLWSVLLLLSLRTR